MGTALRPAIITKVLYTFNRTWYILRNLNVLSLAIAIEVWGISSRGTSGYKKWHYTVS